MIHSLILKHSFGQNCFPEETHPFMCLSALCCGPRWNLSHIYYCLFPSLFLLYGPKGDYEWRITESTWRWVVIMKARTVPKMKDGLRQNCHCDDAPKCWVKILKAAAALMLLFLTGVLKSEFQLAMKVLYMWNRRMEECLTRTSTHYGNLSFSLSVSQSRNHPEFNRDETLDQFAVVGTNEQHDLST